MELSKQVVSLELSRHLKKLGVKQESLFYWVRGSMDYGYEGEWCIKDADTHFLFTENLSSPPTPTDFEVEFGKYDEEGKWIDKQTRLRNKRAKEVYAAFTVAELGNILRLALSNHLLLAYTLVFSVPGSHIITPRGMQICMTEPDIAAKMLVYLIENKLITL